MRIPSIGADRAHALDLARCADATAAQLETCGLEHVRQVTVEGCPPAVVGEWLHAPGTPTVLLYAHHDVQPTGFEERWTSGPFEPAERDGRLYGRGTADNKAGVVMHTSAVRAWLDTHGELPCNVKVFVEAEEEIGSPHLGAFLAEHAQALAADVLVLGDGGNWSVGTPALTYSLRGIAGGDVTIRALDHPLHSGMAGGPVPDPVTAMAVLLASLVDDHGDLTCPGVWDDVRPLTPDEQARIAALPFDLDGWRRKWGLHAGVELTGDPSVNVYERLWFRPSLTIIGFDSHPIEGSSNQIVASATARLSVRVAPGQDPHRVNDCLRAHIERSVPWGLEVTFEPGDEADGWLCEPEGWAFDAANEALARAFGRAPVLMGVGASVPFVKHFAEAFGDIPTLVMGPSDPASRIHSEDESIDLADWHNLIVGEVLLLAEIAARSPKI